MYSRWANLDEKEVEALPVNNVGRWRNEYFCGWSKFLMQKVAPCSLKSLNYIVQSVAQRTNIDTSLVGQVCQAVRRGASPPSKPSSEMD